MRVIITVVGLLSTVHALAQTDAEYFSRLGAMQKVSAVAKLRALGVADSTQAVRALSMVGLQRRFYEVGQSWSVDFRANESTLARKSGGLAVDPTVRTLRRPSRFDYKVLAIDSRLHRASIEVRQHINSDDLPVDPRLERVILTVSEQFVVLAKELFYRDGRAPTTIALNAAGNVPMGFDAYPVDLPDLASREGQPLREVPDELKERPGLTSARALDFRVNDLFARPVRLIWTEGEVWPVYVQSPAGTAILVVVGSHP